MSRSSSDWPIPHHVREEARREREAPQVVARERELEALEEQRREAVAASRRRGFLTADIEYEGRIAAKHDRDEVKW